MLIAAELEKIVYSEKVQIHSYIDTLQLIKEEEGTVLKLSNYQIIFREGNIFVGMA